MMFLFCFAVGIWIYWKFILPKVQTDEDKGLSGVAKVGGTIIKWWLK